MGPSQFWVAGRQVPEPNADTLRVAPVFQYLPQQFKDPSWLPEETACLTDALLKAAQVRITTDLGTHGCEAIRQPVAMS